MQDELVERLGHLQQCQSLPFRLHSLLLQSIFSQCCVHEMHNIAWTRQDELVERLGGVDAVSACCALPVLCVFETHYQCRMS